MRPPLALAKCEQFLILLGKRYYLEDFNRIYEPIVKKNFEWINTIKDSDYEVFSSFDGSPLSVTWNPIKVRHVAADKRQKAKDSDFSWLGSHVLILRDKSIVALNTLLLRNGELLPLIDEGGVALFAYNANVVDALDQEKSSILRFPNSELPAWMG